MGAIHPLHLRAAPGHRIGHAAGRRGCWRRGAVSLGDLLSCRAGVAAIRAAYDPARASRFRVGHPGAADDHPELLAVGIFRADSATEHRSGGTFAKHAAAHPAESEPGHFTSRQFAAKPERPAEPERVVNVAVPEPEFTVSDRLRRFAIISQDVRWRAAAPGTGRAGALAASGCWPQANLSGPVSQLLQL